MERLAREREEAASAATRQQVRLAGVQQRAAQLVRQQLITEAVRAAPAAPLSGRSTPTPNARPDTRGPVPALETPMQQAAGSGRCSPLVSDLAAVGGAFGRAFDGGHSSPLASDSILAGSVFGGLGGAFDGMSSSPRSSDAALAGGTFGGMRGVFDPLGSDAAVAGGVFGRLGGGAMDCRRSTEHAWDMAGSGLPASAPYCAPQSVAAEVPWTSAGELPSSLGFASVPYLPQLNTAGLGVSAAEMPSDNGLPGFLQPQAALSPAWLGGGAAATFSSGDVALGPGLKNLVAERGVTEQQASECERLGRGGLEHGDSFDAAASLSLVRTNTRWRVPEL